MRRPRVPALVLLALRDALRRPEEHALLGAALATVVAVVAVPLLFHQALATTAERVLAGAPSLVIRRVDAGGFVPVEVDEGLESVRSVRGVVRAEARLWGVTASPRGPVTVVAVDATSRARLEALGVATPSRGEAVVGRFVSGFSGPGQPLALRGPGSAGARSFFVRAVLPPRSDAVTHDLVLLEWNEAAALLGLEPGMASDLAVWVVHEAEEDAIQGDLERALPWPVRITGRAESARTVGASLGRRAGLSALAAVPAVLALALLVIATGRQGRSGRREMAILKVLGWTSTDVAWLRLVEALAVGLPAVAVGLSLACGLVLWPGAPDLIGVVLGWSGPPPDLALDGGGALIVMAGVAGVVLVPFTCAALWPALRAATVDPGELLDGARPR